MLEATKVFSNKLNKVGFFLLFSSVLLDAKAEVEIADHRSYYNVGYQIIEFECGDIQETNQTLTAAVWYPTKDKPSLYIYGGGITGMVATNGAPFIKNAPYPLLAFSHGYGGSAINYAFLGEALATYGWIVVAPDHRDRYSIIRIKEGYNTHVDKVDLMRDAAEIMASSSKDRKKFLYRLDEMNHMLEAILGSEKFGSLINVKQVAAGGHSFGGFTAIGISGAIKEYKKYDIKALLLFSTGAGSYLFNEEELQHINIPSMLFIGALEERQKRGTKTMQEHSERLYTNLSPPKYFLSIKGANHFSFNNHLRYESELYSETTQQLNVIKHYSIAFLEKHVVGKRGYDQILEYKHPLVKFYRKDVTE